MRLKRYLLFSCLLWSHWAFSQSAVTGTVTDAETSEPVPGVNVMIKNTSKGTVTDFNGQYSLQVSSDDVLIFSFIGYVTKEVTVGAQSNVDVVLDQDTETLEEVVVVGYGTQKKSLSTGAISSVKADELQSVSNSTVDQALQGRTAGVNITQNSGSPGSGTKIQIRGASSNGNSDPLYIIDGVRTDASGMSFLSPNDIESMEVLKDAASAAIYGAQGANGVIIITTKQGKAGTGVITYSGQYGVQSVKPDLMPMMNAREYQTYMSEANVVDAPVPTGNGTDWFDELYEDAPMQNHSLNFSGGTDKSTFFVGGNIYTQEGVVGGDKSKFDRYTARINSSHQIKDWLKVGENLSYAYIKRRGVAENDEFGSVVSSAIAMDPLTPVTYTNGNYPEHVQTALSEGYPLVKDGNGNYYGISDYVKGEFANPLAMVDIEKGRTVQSKILGNVYAELTPIEGFKFTSRLSVNAYWQRNHDWTPTFWFNNFKNNTKGANGIDNWEQFYSWQFENFASYDRTFGSHHFTLLAGVSQQRDESNYLGGTYGTLFREERKWSYADYVSDANDRIYSSVSSRTLSSVFGRISYDYEGKYLFNATLRRDGSSMLSDENKWGSFPSFSAGWVISNEDFYTSDFTKIVNYAKFRASWGQNGSLSNLSPGQWQAFVSTNVDGVIRYPGSNGVYQLGAAPTNLENRDLKWETSEQVDIGLDLKFLDGGLTFSVDYFNKKTKDLITPGAPPLFSGNTMPFVNAGEVVNKGFEIELGYSNPTSQNFQYSITANLTTLDNEVTYLDPNYPVLNGADVGTGWSPVTQFTEGRPVWYYTGYVTDGIFQNQEQIDKYVADNGLTGYEPSPGDPIIRNVNGDGQISEADRTYIGDPQPDFYYGARINLKYKGFDFLMFMQGKSGNDVLMGFNRIDRPTANKPKFFYEDRWTGEGSTNSWFAANTDDSKIYSSDLMVFDGSYMRIKQLQLGYTLPQKMIQNIGIRNLRVYVSMDNFFTFTDYPGMDPEAGTDNPQSLGIDRGMYPVPRTILGGLTFSF